MRKLLATALGALMLGGGAGVALADHSGPPTSDNLGSHPATYGLCMAWHANENGRANGNAENAPPFVALQEAADENDQSVSDFCAEVRPGGSHGSGNSEAPQPNSHPGRGR